MARIENWNPPELNISTATYTWDVDYAADVHEGRTGPDGNYPGRPWTDDAIGRLDAERVMYDVYTNRNENLQSAFITFAKIYHYEFLESLWASIYTWPRETTRKDGSVVSSPRNIYDTGALYDSQTLSFGDYGMSAND